MSFRLNVINGDIKHAYNPLLDIAIKNAVAKDTNDSIMIEKRMNREKIDPSWLRYLHMQKLVNTSGMQTLTCHCLYKEVYKVNKILYALLLAILFIVGVASIFMAYLSFGNR